MKVNNTEWFLLALFAIDITSAINSHNLSAFLGWSVSLGFLLANIMRKNQ